MMLLLCGQTGAPVVKQVGFRCWIKAQIRLRLGGARGRDVVGCRSDTCGCLRPYLSRYFEERKERIWD